MNVSAASAAMDKEARKYLIFLAFGHFCVDVNMGSLPAILPYFVLNAGMEYKEVAGLMFAASCLSSVIQPLFGYMADRGSRQWFMGLGVLISSLSLACVGFVSNYWAIFAMVTLMGLGSAIFHPEGARMVNFVSGPKRGSGMSIFSVGGNGGFGLGPLLAVALLANFGIKGLAFYGFMGLAMSLSLFVLAPKIREAAIRLDARRQQLQQSEAAGTADAGEAKAGENDDKPEPINEWGNFSRLTLVILFRSTISSAVRSFMPLFCIQILGASHAAGSATLTVVSTVGVVSTLLGGRLADKIGFIKVLRLGSLLLVPALAIAFLNRELLLVYAMLIPMSLAVQGTYSSFVVMGQTYLAKNIGFASGITLGISFSVGGVSLPALGWYGDNFGLEALMVVVVVLSVLQAICTFTLPESKNKV